MKVLVLTNMFPTHVEPAFGSFVAEQVEDIRSRGVHVDVMTFDGRRDTSEYLRVIPRFRRRVRDESYDLVHAHYGLTGAVAVLQRAVPVVTTFHGTDVASSRWKRAISWAVARRCTPIFVSPRGAANVGLPSARVIPCGVSTKQFAPIERKTAREALGLPHDVPIALFPSSKGNRVKSPELFEDAVAVARRSLPMIQTIYLEGLSREAVALALAAADVTVLTSVTEGSPVVPKESLAMETPVVAVDVGDLTTLLENLPRCAVVARDAEELGQHIVRAIQAPRSGLLRERALAYERDAVANAVIETYRDVLRSAER